MEELRKMLSNVSDSYYDFVAIVAHYAEKKPERLNTVIGYMKDHPSADTSDILGFISDRPDFYEDAAEYNDKPPLTDEQLQ